MNNGVEGTLIFTIVFCDICAEFLILIHNLALFNSVGQPEIRQLWNTQSGCCVALGGENR